jgi:predicted DNA-binding protein (MmcQ/YjbR family)
MVTLERLRELSLSYPETTEEPHFEKTSFRVKKKIFATYLASTNTASLKLSQIDQDVFSNWDKAAIHPVPNKWEKQGWTVFDLDKVPETLFADALACAYCEVAPKSLAIQYRPGHNPPDLY